MAHDNGVKAHGDVKQREETQQRDGEHNVGDDHRREDHGFEKAALAAPDFNADGQKCAQYGREYGGNDRNNQRVERGMDDVLVLKQQIVPFHRKPGPGRRHAALIERQGEQNRDRQIEKGENGSQDHQHKGKRRTITHCLVPLHVHRKRVLLQTSEA